MRYTFKAEQWVPYPIELVFAFFANPANLPLLMPAWQRPRIEDPHYVSPPPRPGPLNPDAQWHSHAENIAAGEGSRFTITFRPFPLSPVRLTWRAAIVEFQWNDHFCDEQPSGPFGYWRHCHRVSPQSHGSVVGTTITDDLAYELPFRFLSSPANSLIVARQIRSIFKYRQSRLEPCLQQMAGLALHPLSGRC